MPGHVKLGKAGEADPDPMPYLVVNMETKRADMLVPYDSKKSYWCPDGKGGFRDCILENDDGSKATVMCGHEVINKIFYHIQWWSRALLLGLVYLKTAKL